MATTHEKQGRPDLKIDQRRGLVITTYLATRRAAVHEIDLEVGRANGFGICWLDGDDASVRDLTGYQAALSFRSSPGGTAHLTLTQASGILLAAEEPNVAVQVTLAQVAALAAVTSRGWYDLVLTSPGGVATRLLEGCVAVRR